MLVVSWLVITKFTVWKVSVNIEQKFLERFEACLWNIGHFWPQNIPWLSLTTIQWIKHHLRQLPLFRFSLLTIVSAECKSSKSECTRYTSMQMIVKKWFTIDYDNDTVCLDCILSLPLQWTDPMINTSSMTNITDATVRTDELKRSSKYCKWDNH